MNDTSNLPAYLQAITKIVIERQPDANMRDLPENELRALARDYVDIGVQNELLKAAISEAWAHLLGYMRTHSEIAPQVSAAESALINTGVDILPEHKHLTAWPEHKHLTDWPNYNSLLNEIRGGNANSKDNHDSNED